MVIVRKMGPSESAVKLHLRLVVLSVAISVSACAVQEIRLFGGSGSYEGRVEVKVQDQWGTVCNDTWDIDDVAVVCRQLGNRAARNLTAWYGEGQGSIWLHEVECVGTEERLEDCPHRPSDVNKCSHGEDAGANCSPKDDDLRLVGGAGPHEGRVETYKASAKEWGSICDSSSTWGKEEADVACRQVGYPSGSLRSTGNFGAGNSSALLLDVQCRGTEEDIQQCAGTVLTTHPRCPDNTIDVVVICDVTIPVMTEEFSTGAIAGISIGFGLVIIMCILFSLNCDCKACCKKRDADDTETYPYPSNADRTVTSQTHGKSEMNSVSENQAHSQVDSSAPADPNLFLFAPKIPAPASTANTADDGTNLPNGMTNESKESNGGVPGQDKNGVESNADENHVTIAMTTDVEEQTAREDAKDGENSDGHITDSQENTEQEGVTVAVDEQLCAYSVNAGQDADTDIQDDVVQSRDNFRDLNDQQQTSEERLISFDNEKDNEEYDTRL